jgi:uncharacterized delta-60 repeat protein
MNIKITNWTALFLNLIIFMPLFSLAQDGTLDNSFGINNDGISITDVVNSDDIGRSLVIQPDGKILLAGYSYNGTNNDFSLVRYNPNGLLDNTFDNDGKVNTSVGSAEDKAFSVALQNDGKILVAGYSHNGTDYDFAIVRYNVNGSIDSTFDIDGKVITTNSNSDDRAFAIKLQSDGKIVVAGISTYSSNNEYVLIRYNTSGSIDTTFGLNGRVSAYVGQLLFRELALTIKADGRILLAGNIHNGVDYDFVLYSYNNDGSSDNTFGIGGKCITSVGTSNDIATSIAIQPDGKIIVAGTAANGINYNDFSVVRYNANGTLDNSFDNDGKLFTSIGDIDDWASAVAIQADGKIVVAGNTTFLNSNYFFVVVRYNINGTLDNAFDSDGIITTAVGFNGSNQYAYTMAIQNDDKIVVAGSSLISDFDFSLVRYNINPVGIPEHSNLNQVSISPNPFYNQAILQTKNILNNSSIIIYNSLGVIVNILNNVSGNTLTLNRDNLPSGSYFAQLIQDNKIIFTKKLIIID